MLTLNFVGGAPPELKTARENEWFDEFGQFLGRAFSSEDLRWIEWPGVGVFAFRVGSREVQVWPDSDAARSAVTDTFFRMLQPVILQALGWQALHAGATVVGGGAVAFCGRSNSGKSTLAFAMQQVGGRQLSDDSLVWRFDDRGRATACPLPFAPRLRPATRAYFAHVAGSLDSTLEPQRTEVPLIAIFLLSQDADLARPRVSSVSRAQAFSQVLGHAACFDDGDPALVRQLAFSYLELASCVPVFTLSYPPDFQCLPRMTHAVVETATGLKAAAAASADDASVVPTHCAYCP